MQAITCMQSGPLSKPAASSTRGRLLEAATHVFARDGLHKATTRVIAGEAGVNEVTLFRHFQNKDGLLAAVISHLMESHALQGLDEALWTGDLKKSLLHFAKSLYANLVRDEAFIRTMVGEAQRHPGYAQQIIVDAVKPMRTRFLAHLESARKAGQVRKGLDLAVAADSFTAMLFGGMLRNTAGCAEDYSPDTYVATCADVFAAGLAPVSGS
jgi:AcrR family transcriptional regulator